LVCWPTSDFRDTIFESPVISEPCTQALHLRDRFPQTTPPRHPSTREKGRNRRATRVVGAISYFATPPNIALNPKRIGDLPSADGDLKPKGVDPLFGLRFNRFRRVIVMAQKQPQLPEFSERYIALEKQLLEREAAKLTSGPAKIELQRKIRHLETAAHVQGWLFSPGLRPPN